MNTDQEIALAKQRFQEWLDERTEIALDKLYFQETMRLMFQKNILFIIPKKKTVYNN